MPRAVDLQLLGWAVLVGGSAAWVVHRVRHRPPGATALVAAWLVALAGDRLALDLVVQDLSTGVEAWVLAAVVALAAGRGVVRLHGWAGGPSPVGSVLALVSAAGVWVAVPETSLVLVVAGVFVGAVSIGALSGDAGSGRWPSARTAVAMVCGLAAAVAIGAEGDRHALVGGLLCLTTFVVLGVHRPRPGSIRSVDALIAVPLHGAAALVAARQIGVASSWGLALVAGPAVVVLAALAAGVLRPRQPS